MNKNRRSFTPEFKQNAAALVVEQNYTIAEACSAMDVSESKCSVG